MFSTYVTMALFAVVCLADEVKDAHYKRAETCASCHTHQYREWKGSMMHYSAQSPVFQAFELTTRKLTGRFGAHDPENPTLCINCHSPIAASNNEMMGLGKEDPVGKNYSAISSQGISCTFCHSVKGPDRNHIPEKGLLGDGVANATMEFFAFPKLVGPTISDPLPGKNSYHTEGFWKDKKSSAYLSSAKFCGSCHDVRIPQTSDTETQEPFQRIENLFTEWEKGPYNTDKNPFGRVTSCTDCHMSLYGSPNPSTGKPFPPASFPLTRIAQGSDITKKHALHAFTAVSRSLLEDFPNQDSPDLDEFGFPKGQEQRRAQLLRQACTVSLEPASENGVTVTVTNTGAGHRVPSGFSQERQLWLELKVESATGELLYQSGVLTDKPHPETGETTADSRLHDEDLQDIALELDPMTLETRSLAMGPDFNLRPFRQLGVPQFNNAFLRKAGAGYERVHFFTLTTHMENSRTLPMLEPVRIRYDLDSFTYCGQAKVTATLRYRTLPPKLIRALIQREPGLLSEANLDRNTIIDLNQVERVLPLCQNKAEPVFSPDREHFLFKRNGNRWLAFLSPKTQENARESCERNFCDLPTRNDYDSLGLAGYSPIPGDNHDELWRERWTSDSTPYRFRESKSLAGEPLRELPYFCICNPQNKENP